MIVLNTGHGAGGFQTDAQWANIVSEKEKHPQAEGDCKEYANLDTQERNM